MKWFPSAPKMSSQQDQRRRPSSSSSVSSCFVLFLLTCHSLPTLTSSSGAGTAALKAFKTMDLRYFVAGGTCAAISHGITTPIDVVKTRIQANPKVYDKGMVAAAGSIIQKEGPGALLSGLGPTIVGYGIEGAMKFGLYEVGKPVFGALLTKGQSSVSAVGETVVAAAAEIPPLAFLLASIVAGAIAAMLLCPMESLRIHQVTDEDYANTSLMTGLPKLIQTDGMSALFGGLLAMLTKQIPYTFGKQVSFDVIAKVLYAMFERVKEFENAITTFLTSPGALKWVVSILAAAMASLVACLLSQPGDMILTETYKSHGDGGGPVSSTKKKKSSSSSKSSSPQSFSTVIHTIYTRGGLTEFFRGLQARMVHVGMIITSQLVIYDIVKQALGLPATGSH